MQNNKIPKDNKSKQDKKADNKEEEEVEERFSYSEIQKFKAFRKHQMESNKSHFIKPLVFNKLYRFFSII